MTVADLARRLGIGERQAGRRSTLVPAAGSRASTWRYPLGYTIAIEVHEKPAS
jgi:hypothetical protein